MHASQFPLERDAKAIARSRSLQRLRNAVLIGACVLVILIGFATCCLTAYNMGYFDAKVAMQPTTHELPRFRLLDAHGGMQILGGAAISFIGIVTLFRVLKENQSKFPTS